MKFLKWQEVLPKTYELHVLGKEKLVMGNFPYEIDAKGVWSMN